MPRHFPTTHNAANNYLAEASAMRREGQTSSLGGRKRKVSDANRNASGARLRLHLPIKNPLLAERLQRVVLSSIRYCERRRKVRHAPCTAKTKICKTIILPKLQLCTGTGNATRPLETEAHDPHLSVAL
jgi:hypothetical protein